MVGTDSLRVSTACVLVVSVFIVVGDARAQVQVTTWTPIQEGPAVTLVLGHINGPNTSPELATRLDTPIGQRQLVRLEVGKASRDFTWWAGGEPSPGRVAVTRVVASVIRTRLIDPLGYPSPFYAGFGFGAYRFELHGPPGLSRPWRYGIHALGGFEAPIPNTRIAINGEFQLHLPKGMVESVVFEPLASVSLGFKIRM